MATRDEERRGHAGYAAGQRVRGLLGAGVAAGIDTGRAVTAPHRALGRIAQTATSQLQDAGAGVGRNLRGYAAGLTGQDAPTSAAARPTGFRAYQPPLAAAAPAGRETSPVLQSPDFRAVSAPGTFAPTPQAPPPSQPSPPVPGPGDPNTFTGGNGVTRAVPVPSVPAGAPGRPARGLASSPLERRPAVASTFGVPVTDRATWDAANAPDRSLGEFGAADGRGARAATGGVGRSTGPRAMAEQYNSREDRELQRKLMSDINSQLFALSFPAGRRGREGREAMQAMAALRGQQVALAGGLAGQTGQQVDRRLTVDAQLANTRAQEQGALQRTLIGDATAREGQRLIYRQGMAQIGREMVPRPTLEIDEQGNLLQISGTRATQVTGADGSAVRMRVMQPVDPRVQVAQMESIDLLAQQVLGLDMNGQISDGKSSRRATADEIAAARAFATQQVMGQQPAGRLPDRATFVAELRRLNPNATDAEIDAEWREMGWR